MLFQIRKCWPSCVFVLASLLGGSPAVFATGQQFAVDLTLHQQEELELDRVFLPLSHEQKLLAMTLDFTGLQVTRNDAGWHIVGSINVVPESGNPEIIGLDENRNGMIDADEIRLTPAGSRPGYKKNRENMGFSGKAMLHLKLNCACNGSTRICSTRNAYQISFIDRNTGAMIWGSENHQAVMHNECIFDALLGETLPIPGEIASRDPASISVKLSCGSHTQTVSLYDALAGGQGPQGPQGPQGVRGEEGEPGAQGANGVRGEPGPAGTQGVPGAPGVAGAPGAKGDVGLKGDPGETGAVGSQGPIGLTGAKGDKGDKGDNGSNDVVITGSDNLISITTPTFVGTAFRSEYTDSRLTAHDEALDRKAAVVQHDGKVIRVDAPSALRLGTTAGRWNDIGSFDDVQNIVLSLNGTVSLAVGQFQVVNNADDLRIRILAGKIQEWHTSPTLGGKPVFLEVKSSR